MKTPTDPRSVLVRTPRKPERRSFLHDVARCATCLDLVWQCKNGRYTECECVKRVR